MKSACILLFLLFATVGVRGQTPTPSGAREPAQPAAGAAGKQAVAAEIGLAQALLKAGIEDNAAEGAKWTDALDKWYLDRLDKLKAERAKAGDLDGALLVRGEYDRISAHTETSAEEVRAMLPALRTIRSSYEASLKKIAEEVERRNKPINQRYLADLDALQKRVTKTGDLDQAIVVKAEKERFAAQLAASAMAGAPGKAGAAPPGLPPASADRKPPAAGPVRVRNGTQVAVNLLPLIDPEKDKVAGTWTIEKGALVSSGKGEERIEIPYEPPNEYDFKISYTKTGSNCVIQILSHQETPFIWVMSSGGGFTFHYLKDAGIGDNKTTVHRQGIRDGHKYTSVIRVRDTGVEAVLDGQTVSKWQTDFSDATSAPYWALRNGRLLGLGTGDSKTVFHTIEVIEIGSSGKLTRPAITGAH